MCVGGGGIWRTHSRGAHLQDSFIKKWVKDSACMRSDLSKSLKLNSVAPSCLEGESGEERVACSENAGANAAHRIDSSPTNRRSYKILLTDV